MKKNNVSYEKTSVAGAVPATEYIKKAAAKGRTIYKRNIQDPKDGVLKVGANSKPKAVAGAVAALVEKNGAVEIHAVGAAAVNQAVKAIAIARGFVAPKGFDLLSIIAFTTIEILGQEKTAIKFIVKKGSLK